MFINKKLVSGVFFPSALSTGLFAFKQEDSDYKIITHYNGQADLLISLQIPPDYYPYQFKRSEIYEYLRDINKYLVFNSHTSDKKNLLGNFLQKRLNQLFKNVKEYGEGLWDKVIYDSGLISRNDQFWNNKKTSLLLLEQFIADDFSNIQDTYRFLPRHKKMIITNHRAARDPYTVFSEEIFKCFRNDPDCKQKDFSKKFQEYVSKYNKDTPDSIFRFGRYIEFWNNIHNSSGSNFEEWIERKNLFNSDAEIDKQLAERYQHEIFSEEEISKIKSWDSDWKINYLKLTHHPVLEQQEIPGSSPISEGSQKEVIMFLLQVATLIHEYTKSNQFKEEFLEDYRKNDMESVLENANLMAKNIKERLKKIRSYFQKIGVVDKNYCPETNNYSKNDSKVFGIIAFPPTSFGVGESMIHTISKYPFIYKDIGLKQAVPDEFKNSDHDHHDHQDLFSVDDNGWWWSLGNSNLDAQKLFEFSGSMDKVVFLADEQDWTLLNAPSSRVVPAMKNLLKEDKQESFSYSKYHLWNQGLRSPIALNLLLDNLVDIFQKEYDPSFAEGYKEAMDWGDYWDSNFIIRACALCQSKKN